MSETKIIEPTKINNNTESTEKITYVETSPANGENDVVLRTSL